MGLLKKPLTTLIIVISCAHSNMYSQNNIKFVQQTFYFTGIFKPKYKIYVIHIYLKFPLLDICLLKLNHSGNQLIPVVSKWKQFSNLKGKRPNKKICLFLKKITSGAASLTFPALNKEFYWHKLFNFFSVSWHMYIHNHSCTFLAEILKIKKNCFIFYDKLI